MAADQSVRTRMLTAPVFPLVLRLGVPTMISMLTPAIYNTASTYFVSYLGTAAVGALGVVFALQMLMGAIGIMIGQGCASQTSRLLGAGKTDEASAIAGTGMVLVLAGGLLYLILGELFLDELLTAAGATPGILPWARAYGEILLLGAPVMCASFTLNNLLRSEGLAFIGMAGLVSGGILNVLLTPLFIFTFDLGIEGAAWAAVLSQAVSFAGLLSHYFFGSGLIRLERPTWQTLCALTPRIIGNGVPSLTRNLLGATAASVLNLSAGAFGDAAVAAMSIVGRVLMSVNAIMIGLGQGFQPVLGFNWGAGKYGRIRRALSLTLLSGFVFMCSAAVACWVFAPDVIGLFEIREPEVYTIGIMALQFTAVGFPFIPVSMIANMTFQVLGRARMATFLASLRQGIFFLPAVVGLPLIFGIEGLCAAQSAAEGLAFMVSAVILERFRRQVNEAEKAQNAQRTKTAAENH